MHNVSGEINLTNLLLIYKTIVIINAGLKQLKFNVFKKKWCILTK